MTVQLNSNVWASSYTIRGATLRDNNAPTSLKKHPSDVMPTIVQLDSNALATSCTISGATLRDNNAPTSLKKTSFRRHADDSPTRFQCFSNVMYHQWSNVAPTFPKKNQNADIKCPTRSQCSTCVGLLLGGLIPIFYVNKSISYTWGLPYIYTFQKFSVF